MKNQIHVSLGSIGGMPQPGRRLPSRSHLIRLLAGICGLCLGWVAPARATLFTVTSTADSGNGSLRDAIHLANLDVSTPHTIQFNISGGGAQTITLLGPVEFLSRTLTIDGTTQPGYAGLPLITVDGGGTVPEGLHVSANNCAVKGLQLSHFAGNGMVVEGVAGGHFQANVIRNNSANGIWVKDAVDNMVGGATVSDGNRIAFNTHNGVLITGFTATGNAISHNSIDSNGGLGINLQPNVELPDTVTPNDPLDADTGPNNVQNFPLFQEIHFTGGNTVINGFLYSTPSRTFQIELFHTPFANPKGNGEGRTFAGSATMTTDAAGFGTFSISFPGAFAFEWFAGTATDLTTGDTSEFGPTVQAHPGSFEFSSLTYAVGEAGVFTTITVNRTIGAYGAAGVNWATSVPAVNGAHPGTVCGFDGSMWVRYLTAASTLNFADGETTKTFNINVCPDPVWEATDESVTLTLSGPTGGAVLTPGRAIASLFIIDDDVPVSVSDATSVSVDCFAPDVKSVTFTISIPLAVSHPFSVTYTTADGRPSDVTSAVWGMATASVNYLAIPPTVLTFAPGETSHTVTVSANCGSVPGGRIYVFHLMLSSPVSATILKADGRGDLSYLRLGIDLVQSRFIMLTWHSIAGSVYRVEYKPDFGANANWTPLPGAEMVQGNDQDISVFDQNMVGQTQRYYRLVVVQ